MPNIEVHGVTKEQTAFLRKRLVNALKKASCAKEIVISFVSSEVVDLDGVRQPFLRLWMTGENAKKGLVKELVPLLDTIGFDIEVVELKAFAPKRK